MKISAKAEYAFYALFELSRASRSNGRIRLEDIAERQKIPDNFLVHIMLQLKQAGVVGSKRGAAGGYYLMRSPDKITVGEIIRLFEGPFFPLPSEQTNSTSRNRRSPYCPLSPILGNLRQAVEGVIDDLTFAQVVEQATDVGADSYSI